MQFTQKCGLTILCVLMCTLGACHKDEASTKPASVDHGEPTKPPFEVKGNAEGLLMVWFDEHGPHRLGTFPFLRNVEVRLAQGYPYWATEFLAKHPDLARRPDEPARFARWYRYHVPQTTDEGTMDPLAIPPIADTMPSAIANKLGPGAKPFHAPSLDLTVHFLEDARTEWVLVAAYARRARAGYATCEAEIWSADGRLCAYSTQTMMLRQMK